MDDNTRLRTATAAISLHQTFGSDGQPASYSDVDVTDCILHVGHNVANTQTVLWSRILDRKRGPNPPKIIAIDPRATCTAQHFADFEILTGLKKLAQFSDEAVTSLQPFIENYGRQKAKEPQKLREALFAAPRTGAFGALRDLHDLFLLASEIHIALAIVMQVSKQLRDEALLHACMEMDKQNKRQQAWFITEINHRAPHVLVVPA